jgi:hypothetical protein
MTRFYTFLIHTKSLKNKRIPLALEQEQGQVPEQELHIYITAYHKCTQRLEWVVEQEQPQPRYDHLKKGSFY